MNIAKRRILIVIASLMTVLTVLAQTDKADADRIIHDMLTTPGEVENWHPSMAIVGSMLVETSEQGIYIARGDSFQIKSLRSDFYVRKEQGVWTPLNDGRYPMETMVNLLLNRIQDNRHQIVVRHHQYGNRIQPITMPMQRLFDLLARSMRLYASVTFIDEHEIRAILVMHQPRQNFIHMLELKVDTKELMTPTSTLTGEFYTNIPQSYLSNIFKDNQLSKQGSEQGPPQETIQLK